MWKVVEPLIGNLAFHAWERVTCTRKRAEKNNALKDFTPQGHYYIGWFSILLLQVLRRFAFQGHLLLYAVL